MRRIVKVLGVFFYLFPLHVVAVLGSGHCTDEKIGTGHEFRLSHHQFLDVYRLKAHGIHHRFQSYVGVSGFELCQRHFIVVGHWVA